MRITKDSVVQKLTNHTSGELEGETVLMHLENGQYFGLGETGSAIWQLLQTPIRVSDLCAKLMQKYKVSESTCQSDVIGFLNKLAEAKLLRCV